MSGPGVPRRALFVHGAGGGGWEWAIWQRVFAAHGWRTQAPDLQPSAAGLAATGLDDYRRQVRAWVTQSGGNCALIGASLGGLLALAEAEAPVVRALLLVNPLPPHPEAGGLPARSDSGPVVCWGRDARLASTRRAMREADDAACLYAFRRWRDESAAVLDEARAGIELQLPMLPSLLIASEQDEDVPLALSTHLAQRLGASLQRWPGDHLQPLLGRRAAEVASNAVAWLNALDEFRTD